MTQSLAMHKVLEDLSMETDCSGFHHQDSLWFVGWSFLPQNFHSLNHDLPDVHLYYFKLWIERFLFHWDGSLYHGSIAMDTA